MTIFVACVAGNIFGWTTLRSVTWLSSESVTRFLLLFRRTYKMLGFWSSTLFSGTFLSCISDMSAAHELFWRVWSWCFAISADFTSLITWSRVKLSFAINRRLRRESRKPAIIWVCTIWSRRSPKQQRSALFWRSSLSCWKRLINCLLSKTKATFPLKWSLNFVWHLRTWYLHLTVWNCHKCRRHYFPLRK